MRLGRVAAIDVSGCVGTAQISAGPPTQCIQPRCYRSAQQQALGWKGMLRDVDSKATSLPVLRMVQRLRVADAFALGMPHRQKNTVRQNSAVTNDPGEASLGVVPTTSAGCASDHALYLLAEHYADKGPDPASSPNGDHDSHTFQLLLQATACLLSECRDFNIVSPSSTAYGALSDDLLRLSDAGETLKHVPSSPSSSRVRRLYAAATHVFHSRRMHCPLDGCTDRQLEILTDVVEYFAPIAHAATAAALLAEVDVGDLTARSSSRTSQVNKASPLNITVAEWCRTLVACLQRRTGGSTYSSLLAPLHDMNPFSIGEESAAVKENKRHEQLQGLLTRALRLQIEFSPMKAVIDQLAVFEDAYQDDAADAEAEAQWNEGGRQRCVADNGKMGGHRLSAVTSRMISACRNGYVECPPLFPTSGGGVSTLSSRGRGGASLPIPVVAIVKLLETFGIAPFSPPRSSNVQQHQPATCLSSPALAWHRSSRAPPSQRRAVTAQLLVYLSDCGLLQQPHTTSNFSSEDLCVAVGTMRWALTSAELMLHAPNRTPGFVATWWPINSSLGGRNVLCGVLASCMAAMPVCDDGQDDAALSTGLRSSPPPPMPREQNMIETLTATHLVGIHLTLGRAADLLRLVGGNGAHRLVTSLCAVQQQFERLFRWAVRKVMSACARLHHQPLLYPSLPLPPHRRVFIGEILRWIGDGCPLLSSVCSAIAIPSDGAHSPPTAPFLSVADVDAIVRSPQWRRLRATANGDHTPEEKGAEGVGLLFSYLLRNAIGASWLTRHAAMNKEMEPHHRLVLRVMDELVEACAQLAPAVLRRHGRALQEHAAARPCSTTADQHTQPSRAPPLTLRDVFVEDSWLRALNVLRVLPSRRAQRQSALHVLRLTVSMGGSKAVSALVTASAASFPTDHDKGNMHVGGACGVTAAALPQLVQLASEYCRAKASPGAMLCLGGILEAVAEVTLSTSQWSLGALCCNIANATNPQMISYSSAALRSYIALLRSMEQSRVVLTRMCAAVSYAGKRSQWAAVIGAFRDIMSTSGSGAADLKQAPQNKHGSWECAHELLSHELHTHHHDSVGLQNIIRCVRYAAKTIAHSSCSPTSSEDDAVEWCLRAAPGCVDRDDGVSLDVAPHLCRPVVVAMAHQSQPAVPALDNSSTTVESHLLAHRPVVTLQPHGAAPRSPPQRGGKTADATVSLFLSSRKKPREFAPYLGRDVWSSSLPLPPREAQAVRYFAACRQDGLWMEALRALSERLHQRGPPETECEMEPRTTTVPRQDQQTAVAQFGRPKSLPWGLVHVPLAVCNDMGKWSAAIAAFFALKRRMFNVNALQKATFEGLMACHSTGRWIDAVRMVAAASVVESPIPIRRLSARARFNGQNDVQQQQQAVVRVTPRNASLLLQILLEHGAAEVGAVVSRHVGHIREPHVVDGVMACLVANRQWNDAVDYFYASVHLGVRVRDRAITLALEACDEAVANTMHRAPRSETAMGGRPRNDDASPRSATVVVASIAGALEDLCVVTGAVLQHVLFVVHNDTAATSRTYGRDGGGSYRAVADHSRRRHAPPTQRFVGFLGRL